jgi:hypothetical protein
MAHRAVISKAQLAVLSRLSASPLAEQVYLAGGVAVAIHLGHRRSNDLDFFSMRPTLDLDAVRTQLMRSSKAQVVAITDVTLHVRMDGADVDIVRYEYPPLTKPASSPLGVRVAGIRDLAAMKLAAIARRGIRRDFWDLHEMLDRGAVTLRGALRDYRKKFGGSESDLYHVLRALTWFEDAENERVFPRGLTKAHWKEIRTDLERRLALHGVGKG